MLTALFVCPFASADWTDSLEGSSLSREAAVSASPVATVAAGGGESGEVLDSAMVAPDVSALRESIAETVSEKAGGSFDFTAQVERAFAPGNSITVNTIPACDDPDDCGGDPIV